MNTKAKNRTIFLVVLAAILIVTAIPASSVDAKAAVYTYNGAKLSITNGRAIYTSSDGTQTQLTSSLVVADGAFASDGTVYLLYMNGSLYVYSPKYSNGSVTYYTSGVKTISESGYETSSKEHKNFLTEEELKNLFNGNNSNGNNSNGNNSNGNNSNGNNSNGNNSNGNNSNGNNSNGNNSKGVSKIGSNIIYSDGTYSYVISDATSVIQYFESNGKVYLRYNTGDLKCWDTTTKKLTTVATGTVGLVTSSDGKTITGYYDSTGKVHSLAEITANTDNNQQTTTTTLFVTVGPDKKSVTVVTMASSNASAYSVYTLTLADKNATIDWAYPDKDGTVYIRDNNGGNLYVWNYQIQKDITSAVVNAKIGSNVSTAITTNGLLTGYVEGSSMKQAWSLDQVKVAIAMANANTTTDNNATNNSSNSSNTKGTKAVPLKKVITKNTYKFLYDSNGNEIDEIRLKNKVLYYGDMAFKGVKKAGFSKAGNVVFIKNGKCYGLNTTTLKTKVLMSKNASHFCHNNSGFAVKIQRKNGTKVKITF